MKKTITILFTLTLFIQAVANDKQMTMTTSKKAVDFGLAGTGTAIIDWGDGMPSEKVVLSNRPTIHERNYSTSTSRTITITGDNIVFLNCSDNELIALEVSKNIALEYLHCGKNQLITLNVNNNAPLIYLHCEDNQLTAAALDLLFETLHDNDNIADEQGDKIIYIESNPGTEKCHTHIATEKGWTIYESMSMTTSEKEATAAFDVWDFYNSGVSEDFYNRLNSGQALPNDSQTLKQLQQGISDTLVVRKTFRDKNGNNNLEIKVINPCRLAENFEPGSEDFWKNYRVDGIINYIEVCRTNKNDSDTLTYYNPDVAMSLINLLENNIAIKSVSGKQAVFIPFAYGGNADDDQQITCIVFYDHKKYIYHINLRGEEFENYKIVDNLDEKFKDLPKKLKTELIKYINSQYKEVILEFEEQINTNAH